MNARLPAPPVSEWLTRFHELRDSLEPRAERVLAVARAHWLFRGLPSLGRNVAAYGPVVVKNEGALELGDRLTFAKGMMATSLTCHPGARLVIGADTTFNYGVSLEAWERVELGARCMLASFVRIADRDGHRTAPIVIEDDVWVAHGAIIMPGVRVGARSVVSAGSIVTQDVPPDSLAMGNPARNMSLELVAREPGA
ncbi:acyltransferase [Pyxidicoccus xibeiensis]|uniref:acyltransferase n=1 Tax=Pyxidicoccus xibeiensis TaxID=2906759 RepID=UPI0020A7C6DE|nr:acyltransferase [Pyxidicoccus xibeiensis]MCP3141042.1 acyltransferase [Pyxidicoccus xibeiensis]